MGSFTGQLILGAIHDLLPHELHQHAPHGPHGEGQVKKLYHYRLHVCLSNQEETPVHVFQNPTRDHGNP
jgi:hypothetical protein